MASIEIDFIIERALSEDKSLYFVPDLSDNYYDLVNICLSVSANYYYKEGSYNKKYEDSYPDEEEIDIISMIDESGLKWDDSDLTEEELIDLHDKLEIIVEIVFKGGFYGKY